MTTLTFAFLILVTYSVIFPDNGTMGSYNVAKGKAAVSSSVLNGYNKTWTAGKAVDGNPDQNVMHNSCLHTQENRERHTEFLTVNLKGVFSISRIEIYFVDDVVVKDRSIGYSLMISRTNSTDGPYCYQDHTLISTNFLLHQNQSCEGTGQFVSIVQSNISKEIPPLNVPKRVGPILEVCEFKVYGCPVGRYGTNCTYPCSHFCIDDICNPDNGTCTKGCKADWNGDHCNETKNLAYMKNASSSSVLPSETQWNASKAVDGNSDNNVWCNSCLHTNGTPGVSAYLNVVLGQLSSINRVEIYFVKYDDKPCEVQKASSTDVPNRSRGFSIILSAGSTNLTCYKDNTSANMTFNFTQNHRCVGIAKSVTIYQPNSSMKNNLSIGPILEICELKVFGCKLGMFGDKCQNKCPLKCIDKQCDPDVGTCHRGCIAGWKGPQCSEECSKGTYGLNCTDKCGRCRSQTDCNKTSGVCPNGLCESGVKGSKCEQECPNGTFGFNCKGTCGHCKDNEFCNKTSGACPNSCDKGFNGTNCTEACPNGTYWYNCIKQCGKCRSFVACNTTSGECPNHLCESGVNGSNCDKECPNGTFGFDCLGQCGNCRNNSVCNKQTGACPDGYCNKGYQGSNCSNECSNGTYGFNCHKTCGKCRGKEACNTKTGVCPNKLCERGYNGTRCDQDCPNGTFGYDCKGICGYCRDGSVCNKTTGACPLGRCEKGYEGIHCSNECADYKYGYDCDRTCGNCRDNVACNKTTGDCPNELCASGVNGSKCDQSCPNGTYGFDCKGICGYCVNNSVCNRMTGGCPADKCERGYHESNCTKECADGYYGYNCRHICGKCANQTVCNKTTGICPNGVCDRGVNGSKCDQVCNGTYGYNCNETCGHCRKDLFCDARYGNCSQSICMWGFEGLHCDERTSRQTDSDNNISVISGGVAAVLIVAILVIVIVVVMKRRKMSEKKSSQYNDHEFSDFVGADPTTQPRGNGHNSSGVFASTKKMNSYIDIKDTEVKDADDEEIEQEYVNVQLGKRPDKDYQMPCRTLADIVKEKENNENKIFKEEFGALPKGQLKPCEAAKMPSNMPKNRFKTTFPYDDTRIVLKTDGAKESDYVNANYIKDTNGRCTYIASQGPRTHTVVDMWRMVWQEEISCIVMLTNLQEKRIDKCAKYWPNVTCTEIYGQISIKTIKENIYGNYTIRVFKITNTQESESRDVSHYHYTTWPDHGVPESLDLVIFHNKVQRQAMSSSKSGAPLLVHCSAGIGRTGTFIALDALLSHSKDNDSVNIFQFVKHMREEDRMNMIQTVDQYVAIHHLLLEAIRTKYYPIQKSSFAEEVKRMCSTSSPANQNVFRRQISELNDLKPNYSDDDFTRGLHNQDCNIDPNILPVDRYMLYLTTFVKGRNDYINAITVPIQTALHSIVVTSNPKDNTTVDLIRLILDHGSFVVDLSGSTNGQQWYPDPSTTRSYNPFEVERSELKTSNIANVTESDCTIFQKQKDSAPLSFRLFESKIWPSDVSNEDGLRALCGLVRRVMLWNRTSTNGKLILVSKDGVTRCDVFCAVYNALEQLEMDEEVDMFNIVRQLQIRRPQFIPTMEEYKLCFDAVSYDLESNNESIYANV